MAGPQDIKQNEETYTGVMSMLKWGTIVCMAFGALIVILISS